MYWEDIKKVLENFIDDCDPNLDTGAKVAALKKFIEELENIILRRRVQNKLLDFGVVVDRNNDTFTVVVRSTYEDKKFSLAQVFEV